jgi:hypothetical protein
VSGSLNQSLLNLRRKYHRTLVFYHFEKLGAARVEAGCAVVRRAESRHVLKRAARSTLLSRTLIERLAQFFFLKPQCSLSLNHL